MSEQPGGSRSWWTTLPGVLSGIAAVVTALAAFLAALVQAGLIGHKHEPRPPETLTPRIVVGPGPPVQPTAVDERPMQVGPFELRLTEHWWQSGSPGEARLHLRWQVTNQGPRATTFDPGRTLRLVLPDGERPPRGNRPSFETVQPKEALVGESEFALAAPTPGPVIAVPAMEGQTRQERRLPP